ncbi:MAG TPA: aspartyl protease family protein, partial [Gemmatimonadaceae bacterium]|nr:aspartyl protease family protein [Gemmatimonadaceae bacterium]
MHRALLPDSAMHRDITARHLLVALGLTFASAVLCAIPAAAQTSQASASVTTPIRVVNNHVYVRVTSGGREMWFLLDTGAGASLMNMATADSLGIPLGDSVRIGGAGPAVVRGARLKDATVRLAGDPSMSVSPRVAMPMTGLNNYEGIPVSGILGHDFLVQRVIEIDYAAERLTLYDPKTFRYSGSGARVPITIRDNYPHVNAELELKDGGRITADLIIDVGSSGALALGKPLVEKHRLIERTGPTIYRQTGRGAGGAMRAHMGRLARLRLGTAEVVSPIAGMHGDSAGVFSHDRLFEGNIGGEVLRRFTVILDYGRKEMILQPNAAHDEPFEADMSGAGFRIDSAHAGLRVTDIMKDGPAAQAGLEENDLITAIDGKPAMEYGVDALRLRLRRQGGEITFTVLRDGVERTIRIPIRRLVMRDRARAAGTSFADHAIGDGAPFADHAIGDGAPFADHA